MDDLVCHLGMLWSICTTRKEATCCRTAKSIPAGARAYRPITNNKHRMLRMLPNHSLRDAPTKTTATPKGGPL